MTQLFAFSDKHAAFERNGNMSLFEKFELAREVSEICDSVVPLIKVVIVEGGKRGAAASDDVVAAVHAAAAGHRRSRSVAGWDAVFGGKYPCAAAEPDETQCRNPFGAIMDDDWDACRTCTRKNGAGNKQRRKSCAATAAPATTATAGKCIELEVYSRSVSYFHEQQPPANGLAAAAGCASRASVA